ncbi:MAG: DUF3099 domain-containing protein [Dermatophilaceae bacterium]
MAKIRKNPSAQLVTGVAESPAEDQSRRLRRYLVTMSVRTACFILMVVVDGWLRWVFAAGAVFLPFFAVVTANAARPRATGRVRPVVPVVDHTRQLTTSGAPTEPASRTPTN